MPTFQFEPIFANLRFPTQGQTVSIPFPNHHPRASLPASLTVKLLFSHSLALLKHCSKKQVAKGLIGGEGVMELE